MPEPQAGKQDTRMQKKHTSIAVLAMLAAGLSAAGYAAWHSHTLHAPLALAILALAAATSRMKVKLPGIEGNMSVNLPFLLLAAHTLSGLEAILIASISTVAQCWPKSGSKLKPEQMLFNVSMMAFATFLANTIAQTGVKLQTPVVAAATAAFFLGQTVPVAGIIHLTQGTSMSGVWKSIAQLSFPYFVLSAGMSSMLNLASREFGWQATLLALPVMFGVYRSFRGYFGREGEANPPPPMAKAVRAGA
jgi:hypothetical protein